mgnify:CR=1 FL=1
MDTMLLKSNTDAQDQFVLIKNTLTALVGLFDAAPSAELFAGFMGSLSTGATLDELVDNWVASEEFALLYSPDLTNEAFAQRFVRNLLGSDTTEANLAEGEAFILARMNEGMTKGQAAFAGVQALSTLPYTAGYWFYSAREALANKVNVAAYYVASYGGIVEPEKDANMSGEPLYYLQGILDGVNSYVDSVTTQHLFIDEGRSASVPPSLTVVADSIMGTAVDDTILGSTFEGQMTLQTDDTIDGRLGNDTLEAKVVASDMEGLSPSITSVENVRFQARKTDTETSTPVVINATHMDGTRRFTSTSSDNDLILRHIQPPSHLTTLVLQDSASNVNLKASFDNVTSPKGFVGQSQLRLEILDLDSSAKTGEPLAFNPYIGVRVQLGDQLIDISMPGYYAHTYEDLIKSLNYSLRLQGIENIEATLGNSTFSKFNSDDGIRYSGTEIRLTYTGLETFKGIGWIAEGVLPGFNVHTAIIDAALSEDTYTQTNLVLDNAGQGEQGGEVLIESDNAVAINRVNVRVEDSSWVSRLATTEGKLQQIVVSNAKDHSGDLRIGQASGEEGLQEVQRFDASAMTGSVDLTATLGLQALSLGQKYNGLGGIRTEADEDFIYQTGSANDRVVLTVAETPLSYEDFVLAIATLDGDDNVTLTIQSNETGNTQSPRAETDMAWYQHQASLDNVRIATGKGNDAITLIGRGEVQVNLGAGTDTLTLSNSEYSRAIVEFTEYDQGHLSIAHFQAGSAGDVLDFSAYLTSNSTTSTNRADIHLNTSDMAQANSISIIDFVAGVGTQSNETFANLTADHVRIALNSRHVDSQYGNGVEGIDAGDLSAASTSLEDASLKDAKDYLVLIHNEANQGEYKAFHLTSKGTTQFETATLIGTLDLGEEQTCSVENFV